MRKRVIAWFRNDLRIDDNESLIEASEQGDVIPVFVFDSRIFKGSTRDFGFPKTGRHRTKFLIESVTNLRNNLRAIGSDLIVRVGKTEDEVASIAEQLKTSWVFCNRERTQEEVEIQDALENNLWSLGQELRYCRGKMLYHTADLPFPVSHTPDTFTTFRKEVERIIPVREPIDAPSKLPAVNYEIDTGAIPTMEDLGWEPRPFDERSVLDFQGGETAGLKRVDYYLWQTDLAKTYKETRNGLLGGDYSTKFSAWLANGSVSPKRIYHMLKNYEAERGSNQSTYWIFFELLWRDFFRLMAKKHGNCIFLERGPKDVDTPEWSEHGPTFMRWAKGETGVPFIDANMRELNQTGFMSNRGRQNVASFLVKDLKINWQLGAEYFESQLIDYDVASNWGNWNYVAGVGSDPRENRYFNILAQATNYDPHGEYVKQWLPELRKVPAEKIHRPDNWTQQEQTDYDVQLGVTYPNPMIRIAKWDQGSRKESNRNRKNRRDKGNRSKGFAQLDF